MRFARFMLFFWFFSLPFSLARSEGLSDLKISSVLPSSSSPHGKTVLNVTIANAGTGPSGACSLRLFCHGAANSVKERSAHVPSIGAGKSVVIPCGFEDAGGWEAGVYSVIAVVDDKQEVVESDESNNDFVTALRWRGVPRGSFPIGPRGNPLKGRNTQPSVPGAGGPVPVPALPLAGGSTGVPAGETTPASVPASVPAAAPPGPAGSPGRIPAAVPATPVAAPVTPAAAPVTPAAAPAAPASSPSPSSYNLERDAPGSRMVESDPAYSKNEKFSRRGHGKKAVREKEGEKREKNLPGEPEASVPEQRHADSPEQRHADPPERRPSDSHERSSSPERVTTPSVHAHEGGGHEKQAKPEKAEGKKSGRDKD